MTETTSRPVETDSDLWTVIQGVELIDIRVVRWHSELLDYASSAIRDFDPVLDVDFRRDDDSMQLRWSFDSVLRSTGDVDVARLGLTLVQTFAFTEALAGAELSGELVQRFIEKTAVISVIPFVREAVQTMTVRLGLPAVTLGLVRAGETGPHVFSVRS
ncbi:MULTISPECIES: hypothetical protein [Catenuloplanes]|uniref:Uncharacterized protein n=1 Tax=Catenuloplanes niger TaxID=587534 RepID=A0AAE4CVM9_9ACTN|nr:hypothetical protein [Catenuloplanes niger]MDR7325602.1 hypothetical protein [Catenuloplanes niger]